MKRISQPFVTYCLMASLAIAVISVGAAPVRTQQQDSFTLLTNSHIVQMVKAGLSSEVIIAKIKSSGCNFDTFPSVLQELKFRGVPNDVILAMVEAPHGPARATTTRTGPASSESKSEPVRMISVSVPAGTALEIETAYTVSSADVEEGSAVTFRVVHPVKINGATVIEKGAIATARITKAKKGGSWGRAGQIAWLMQDVAAVDGSRIPLEFTKSTKGDSKGGTVATGVIVTGILFWPAAPLWGFKRGKNAVVPAGKRFEVFVHNDAEVKTKAASEEIR